MHFPSIYLNYSSLHLEKMHTSLEVFKEIQRGCCLEARNAPYRKHKCHLPCRPTRAILPGDDCHILKTLINLGFHKGPCIELSLTGHWLSVNTHLFIHSSTIFFSAPLPCLAVYITLEGWDRVPTLMGDCRWKAAKQKRIGLRVISAVTARCMKKGPHATWTWGKWGRVGPKDEKGLASGGGEKGPSGQSDQQRQRHGMCKNIMDRARSIKSLEISRDSLSSPEESGQGWRWGLCPDSLRKPGRAPGGESSSPEITKGSQIPTLSGTQQMPFSSQTSWTSVLSSWFHVATCW